MIKIIGGIKKRTKIQISPDNVRPTSIQKRESIFSIIENHRRKTNDKIYEYLNILDIFAGSGSLGLEAISRGAFFGYFYENNSQTISYLRKNCQKICTNNSFKIIKENILESKFKDVDKKISLVFIDPPYKINPFEKILINIHESIILSKDAIIVIECSQKTNITIPPYFSCFTERIYRKTKILFLINKTDKTK